MSAAGDPGRLELASLHTPTLSGLVEQALPPPPTTVVLKTNYYGTVTLDHAAHLARKIHCKDCHGPGKVSQIEFTPRLAHDRCRSCHVERKQGPTDCRGCHELPATQAAREVAKPPSGPAPPGVAAADRPAGAAGASTGPPGTGAVVARVDAATPTGPTAAPGGPTAAPGSPTAGPDPASGPVSASGPAEATGPIAASGPTEATGPAASGPATAVVPSAATAGEEAGLAAPAQEALTFRRSVHLGGVAGSGSGFSVRVASGQGWVVLSQGIDRLIGSGSTRTLATIGVGAPLPLPLPASLRVVAEGLGGLDAVGANLLPALGARVGVEWTPPWSRRFPLLLALTGVLDLFHGGLAPPACAYVTVGVGTPQTRR
jgi:hypothetical protein